MRYKRKRGQSVDEGTVLLVLETMLSDVTGHETATHPWAYAACRERVGTFIEDGSQDRAPLS